jgi:hypothetical protein
MLAPKITTAQSKASEHSKARRDGNVIVKVAPPPSLQSDIVATVKCVSFAIAVRQESCSNVCP